jgi:hypothetical protein
MNDRCSAAPGARLEIRRPAGWLCLAGAGLLACIPCSVEIVRAQQKGPSPPSWYSKPAANPQVLVAKASAASKDKQLAIDKAVHDARVELGQMVRSRIDSIRRSAEREAALDKEGTQRYTQAGSNIVTVLKGSRVRNQRQIRKGKVWTAFVVVEIPLGATSAALLAAVKDDALLTQTFGPTQAFRALEAEVAAYHKRPGTPGKK